MPLVIGVLATMGIMALSSGSSLGFLLLGWAILALIAERAYQQRVRQELTKKKK